MKYRYPGIQSFTNEDQNLFFGRDHEVKELFRLVVLNPLTVVFGKSGIGKTSLLQAGVAPLLEERFLYPAKIRLNNIQQSISKQIYEQLNEAELLPLHTKDDLSFWEYCQKFLYISAGELHTPVLILDQFEELFTLYHDQPQVQRDFILQLASIINQRAPESLIQPEWTYKDRERFLKPPKVHIVISIRSDYLYLLDRLSDQIPSILRCRYELKALDENNARLAITQPALLPQEFPVDEYGESRAPFTAPPFQYSSAALTDIINNLTLINGDSAPIAKNELRSEIEAFQLQLLCRNIEDRIIANACPANFEVDSEFYGGKVGIVKILKDFYSSVLSKFDETTRPKIQNLIEEKLLIDGRRILQEKEFLKKGATVSDEDLAILAKERLIKEEPRGGSFYYEISHDTLLAPIIEARDKRRQQDLLDRKEAERLANEQRARDAEAQAKIEKEKRAEAERLKNEAEQASKRARKLAILASMIALVALVLLFVVIDRNRKIKADENVINSQLDSLLKQQIIQDKLNQDLQRTLEQRDNEEFKRVWAQVEELEVSLQKLKKNHPEVVPEFRQQIIDLLKEYKHNTKLQDEGKKAGYLN